MTPHIPGAPPVGPNLFEAFNNSTSRSKLTCVFFDVVNSTQWKANIPESGWLPQLGFFYDTVVRRVARYEHVILKFNGDGIILYFPGDDSAGEAIQVAVDVQQALQDAARPVDGMKGKIEFYLTTGISTGVAHRFVTPNGTYDYVGAMVDKAARLCGAASAQAIFVDPSTVTAANFHKVGSPMGLVLRREPNEYVSDRQSLPLKGIPTAVEYHEIFWDAQLFGVKSEHLTKNRDQAPAPVAAFTTPTRTPSTRTERVVGRVKSWNSEGKFGFVTANNEDFYVRAELMAFPEDVEDLKPSTQVAFVAIEPAKNGRSRRAGALLVVGNDAEGVIVNLSEDRPYGWIDVADQSGNVQPVFVSKDVLPANVKKGDVVTFSLEASARGARAVDVEALEEDAAA